MVDTGLEPQGNSYSGYPYRKVEVSNTPNGVPQYTFKYSFRTHKKRCYIVLLEQYDYKMFIIKFYPKVLQLSPKKYNIKLKALSPIETIKVLSTCARIALKEFALKDSSLSFGFIGAESETDETKERTQRFRVYEPLVSRFFDPKDYVHAPSYQTSAYAIISKENKEPDILTKLEALFREHYVDALSADAEEEFDSPR